MEIGLRVCALGLVFFSYQVPSLLGDGAMHKVHFGGVGEPLQQEVACNGVLVLPLDDSSCLVLGRFSGVDGLGYGLRPVKKTHRRVTFIVLLKHILKMAQFEPLYLRARYVG